MKLVETDEFIKAARLNKRIGGQSAAKVLMTVLRINKLNKLYEEISATQADYLMLHTANLHNLDDLLTFKPRGKTIVFWDFDDTMYIVHKDLSDRLWGDSSLRTFGNLLRYKLVSAFQRSKPAKISDRRQRGRDQKGP